jgi:hypothetical protein
MNLNGLKIFHLFLLSIITLTLCVFFISGTCINFAHAGVDDLRGRWDIVVEKDVLGPSEYNFTIFVNNLTADPNNPSNLLAAGCMLTNQSGFLSPMSLKAIKEDDAYKIIFLGTAILFENQQPFLIQFSGPAKINGNGVPDDLAGGEDSNIITEFTEQKSSWFGIHHDRRLKKCPPAQIPPLNFSIDVRAHLDLNYSNISLFTGFDCGTDIVSFGVRVDIPDGTSLILKPYTDIFSPNVDFVSSFRFTDGIQGVYPISGEPYTFTLLDAVGNPIPGTTKTDVWTGPCVDATQGLTAEVRNIENNVQNIYLSWDHVEGRGFYPLQDIGFYQVEIFAYIDGYPTGSTVYGANWVGENEHLIPWTFIVGADGYPDGYDLGVGLKDLEPGTYMIRIVNHGFPPESNSQGQGFECVVSDGSQIILFEKQENGQITLYE